MLRSPLVYISSVRVQAGSWSLLVYAKTLTWKQKVSLGFTNHDHKNMERFAASLIQLTNKQDRPQTHTHTQKTRKSSENIVGMMI